MKLFLFLALLIAVVIIVFTAQNQTEITLMFFNWEFSKPLPIMLAVPFFVGAIAGVALIFPAWMKKSKTVKTNKRQIQELEEKLLNISEEAKTEETEEAPVEEESPKKSSEEDSY